MQRRPESQRWFPELLGAIRATPWRNPGLLVGEEPAETLPPLPAEEQAPARVTDEASRNVKSVYIRKIDLDKYGYTSSCRKCQKMRVNQPSRGLGHNTACRNRIELANVSPMYSFQPLVSLVLCQSNSTFEIIHSCIFHLEIGIGQLLTSRCKQNVLLFLIDPFSIFPVLRVRGGGVVYYLASSEDGSHHLSQIKLVYYCLMPSS